MIRSVCQFVDSGNNRCSKVSRARRIHKFCRVHTKEVTGQARPIPKVEGKPKMIKAKPVKVEVQSKRRKQEFQEVFLKRESPKVSIQKRTDKNCHFGVTKIDT